MIDIFVSKVYENRKSVFRNTILAGLIVGNVVILLNSLGTYKSLKMSKNLLNAKDIPIKLNKKLVYLQYVSFRMSIKLQINMKLNS